MKSVTYNKVSRGLRPLRRVVELKVKEYRKHQHGLSKFVFWWNSHVVQSKFKNDYIKSVLFFRRKSVVCTGLLIDHDLFKVEVTLTPYNSTDDIGNGAGRSIVKTF